MKIALGTVQFGLDYGITNESGIVNQEEVNNILQVAIQNDINLLDTAAAYGKSEEVIGNSQAELFKIVSKIPKLSKTQESITDIVEKSLSRLGRTKIYAMMFHDENDLINKNAEYNELLTLKEKGLIEKVGCSFYSVEALELALNKQMEIDVIQIPASCLDQRFEKSGLLHQARDNGIEVHSRSLFLQGLLLSQNSKLPYSIQKYKSDLDLFFEFARINDMEPIDLAVSFLATSKVIDFGIVGCQSSKQLLEILASYKKVNNIKKSIDFSHLASSNSILLNPSLWE